jgi:hypothetical protein
MSESVEKPLAQSCCECKHFRMFKPQLEWCTSRKERVNPFGHCKRFVMRARYRGVWSVFDREHCRESAESYAKSVKDAGVTYLE